MRKRDDVLQTNREREEERKRDPSQNPPLKSSRGKSKGRAVRTRRILTASDDTQNLHVSPQIRGIAVVIGTIDVFLPWFRHFV